MAKKTKNTSTSHKTTKPVKKAAPATTKKKNVAVAKKAKVKKAAPKAAPAKKVAARTVVKPAVAAKPSPLKKTAAKSKVAVAAVPAKKKPEKKKEAPMKEVKVPKTSVKTSRPYSPSYKPLEERKAEEGNVAPMLRYSDADLEEFKVLINKKLEDASREVAYLQGIITRKDGMGSDSEGRYMTMEDGTVSMEREQMSQMVSRQISFIDNLKKALIRIENKTYGICRVTGKLIDKARLRAVPHATLSLEAKLGMSHRPKE